MDEEQRQGAVAVVSGGLDSVAALYLARERYSPLLVLTFDYGQPAAVREVEAAGFFARRLGLEHRVIPLRWLAGYLPAALDAGVSDDRAVWVPNRNGLFVNAAAAVAEAEGLGWVLAGFNRDEAAAFPDNSAAFVDAATGALRYSTAGRVALASPTVGMGKVELARYLRDEGAETARLWSCYGAGPGHCGCCPSCRRLFAALEAAGVERSRWPPRS